MSKTRARLTAAAALLLVPSACAPTSGPASSSPVRSPTGSYLYVANQEAPAISVIDLSTREVVEIIDLEALGYGAAPKPHHIAVEPDGSFWYVSLIGGNAVLKFDRDNELVASAEVEVPGLLALHPVEDWLFVGRSMAAVDPPQRIGRIQRSTMEIEEFDVFLPRPHAMAVGPGNHVYVGSLAENTLAIVDGASGQADLLRIESREPHVVVQLAVSPDRRTLVATGQLSGRLLTFAISEDGAGLTAEAEVLVGREPWHPSFTPDGREVWMGALGDDQVTVVDTGTWQVTAVIEAPSIAQPHGSAASPDGRYMYVANRNESGTYEGTGASGDGRPPGTVVVIDVQSRQPVEVIETPPYAAGLGIASGLVDRSTQNPSWLRRVTPFAVSDEEGSPFGLPFLGGFDTPRPQLVDIDRDGDLDLFVQEDTDRLLFFERVDSSLASGFAFRPDAFADLRIGEWYRFVDVDGDGARDLLAEEPFSYLRLYRNTGESGLPSFEVFADTLRDSRNEPIFSDRQNIPNAADLDCDGMLDLLIGRLAGTITHYEATGLMSDRAAPLMRVTDRFENIEIVADPAAPSDPNPPAPLPLGTLGALPGPFVPVRTTGGWRVPRYTSLPTMRHGANTMALADVDADGDTDLFWGDFFEPGLLFIENTGSCAVPNFRGEPLPFPVGDPIQTSGYNAPTFGDLDGDGDLDLLMGVLGGAYDPNTTTADNLLHFSQTADGGFDLETRRFVAQIDVGTESIPSLVDLDADGDLDLLLANRIDPNALETSRIYRFENVGSGFVPELRASGTLDVEGAYHNAAAFGDLDGDGDLDAVLGTWRTELLFLENTGSTTDPQLEVQDPSIVTIERGSNATPTLGDLDGDGDLDLIVGEAAGTLSFYRNVGGLEGPDFELVSDGYLDVDVGRRSAPLFVDFDQDGDLDLAVGSEEAGILYFENRGDGEDPALVEAESPFPDAADLPALSAPALGDLDGDGDLDLVVGGSGGGVYYFEGQ